MMFKTLFYFILINFTNANESIYFRKNIKRYFSTGADDNYRYLSSATGIESIEDRYLLFDNNY